MKRTLFAMLAASSFCLFCREKQATIDNIDSFYFVNSQQVELKREPQVTSETLLNIELNEPVEVIDETMKEERFLKVIYQGKTGYVREKSLSSHPVTRQTLPGKQWHCRDFSNYPTEEQSVKDIVLSENGKYSIRLVSAPGSEFVYTNMGYYIENKGIIELGKPLHVECIDLSSRKKVSTRSECIDDKAPGEIYRIENMLILHKEDRAKLSREPDLLNRLQKEMDSGTSAQKESVVACTQSR